MGRAIFLLMVLAARCAGAQGVQGTVFELTNPEAPRAEWRRIPAVDAFAIAHWIGYRPGFGHYESVCLQAAIGRTDAAGRFSIPQPSMRARFVLFRSDPAVAIYKPGFEAQSGTRPRSVPEWFLVPTRMTAAQRAVYVDIFRSYGCTEDDGTLAPLVDPQGVLPAFRRALQQEIGR